MKALVTGATGFVGSHVARELIAQGHSVRALHRIDSRLTALEGIDYEPAIGALNDPDSLRAACEGCDWVFHVAAVADYWRADRSQMFQANVEGTRHVLESALATGVKRVVFTSSAAAVGLKEDGTPADESVAFNLPPAHFPYGYSKALAERVVQEFVARGLDVVTVNPVVVMGPGDLNMISGTFIVQMAQYGRWTPITRGGIAVVDVRDVARWQVLAAQRGVTGERYLLGTANYTYAEWFGMIAETLNAPRPLLTVPSAVIPALAALNDRLRRLGIRTPVDADQMRLSTRYAYFDPGKAWAAFGLPQVPMPQSLRDTYQWYTENGFM